MKTKTSRVRKSKAVKTHSRRTSQYSRNEVLKVDGRGRKPMPLKVPDTMFTVRDIISRNHITFAAANTRIHKMVEAHEIIPLAPHKESEFGRPSMLYVKPSVFDDMVKQFH